MAQDPAFLFMYKDWLTSMAGWDADIRGWYINLLCHQADKPDGLINDMETLAELAGVKISQYVRFQECWKHTLVAQFEVNAKGLLQNKVQAERLETRRNYKNKQAKRGTVGAFVKKMRAKFSLTALQWNELSQDMVKAVIDLQTHEEIDFCLKHTLKAYALSIYANGNANSIIDELSKEGFLSIEELESLKPEEEGKKSVYTQCVDLYFNFYKERSDGMPPKFDKKHGEAMKSIINHLKKSVKHKQPDINPPDIDAEVVKSFAYILDNWDKQTDFIKQQTDLTSINSNFNRIITDLKTKPNLHAAHKSAPNGGSEKLGTSEGRLKAASNW